MVNARRFRAGGQLVRYSDPLIQLPLDIFVMSVLCFHQRSLSGDDHYKSPARFVAHLPLFVQRFLGYSPSSLDIGRRIGLQLDPPLARNIAQAIIDADAEDWEACYFPVVRFRTVFPDCTKD